MTLWSDHPRSSRDSYGTYIGWDTPAKANVLIDTFQNIKQEDPWEEWIRAPTVAQVS